jgi:muramoyltetrapeptide carboxypeptidase
MLEPGSVIRVISPSLPSMAYAHERVRWARRALEKLGLEVEYSRNCFEISDDGTNAGTAAQRAADLHDAFRDPHVSAVLCAVGGKSTIDLLPELDPTVFQVASPKAFIGRSDNVVLNAFLLVNASLVSYYGVTFLPQFGEPPAPMSETLASFISVLMSRGTVSYQPSPTGTMTGINWHDPAAAKQPRPRDRRSRTANLRQGRAVGQLVGGEISILATLAERELVSVDGAVIFWDVYGEQPGYLEHHFKRLADSVDLSRAAGMLVGDNPWVPFDEWLARIRRQLDQVAPDATYPIMVGGDCGHFDPAWVLPYGDFVVLDTSTGLSYPRTIGPIL